MDERGGTGENGEFIIRELFSLFWEASLGLRERKWQVCGLQVENGHKRLD